MTSIKEYVKEEPQSDTEESTDVTWGENIVENPAWCTIEDNHTSIITEHVDKVIKFEKDTLNNYSWESVLEIPKKIINNFNELPSSEHQTISNEVHSKDENISNKRILHCHICGKQFALNFRLKNHIATHRKNLKFKKKLFKCNFCKKIFKFSVSLDKHIKKCCVQKNGHESSMYKCNICYHNFTNQAMYDEHMLTHENEDNEKNDNLRVKLKLCRLNGIWKSKPKMVYKCDFCPKEFFIENSLLEHNKTHNNDDQMQCKTYSTFRSDSELIDHVQQINNINQECNEFDKKINPNHNDKNNCCNLWPQSPNNKVLRLKNNKKSLTVCEICGISFNNSMLLDNHMASGCKPYSCTCCGRTFNQLDLLFKHIYECQKCVKADLNVNKTQNLDNFTSSSSLNTIDLCMNATGSNSSNFTHPTYTDNSSEKSVVHNSITNQVSENLDNNKTCSLNTDFTKSEDIKYISVTNPSKLFDNSVMHNLTTNQIHENFDNINNIACHLNIKKEKGFCSNDAENNKDFIHAEESSESSMKYNLTSNQVSGNLDNDILAYPLNIKKENNSQESTFATCTDQLFDDTIEQNLMTNEVSETIINNDNVACHLNIKKEKGLCTNDTENSSDFINENFGNSGDDNSIACVDTDFIAIRKVSETEILSLNSANNKHNNHSPQINVFICKICENNMFRNKHSLALHMSYHNECSLFECIVCNKKFDGIVSWKNHMSNHEQQIGLSLLESKTNPIIIEPNALNGVDSENLDSNASFGNTESEIFSNTNFSSEENICTRTKSLRNSKKLHTHNICNNKHCTKLTLMNHQTHEKPLPFSCRYCNKKFSNQGPCTNHEKSHLNNKSFLHNAENEKLKQNKIQNHIKKEIDNIGSISVQRNTRNMIKCDICQKEFKMRGYWTNHMKIRHKINPKSLEQLSVKNNTKSVGAMKTPLLSSNKTLNNSWNKSIKKKLWCKICEKKFKNLAALISHMKGHSNEKPFPCQYCSRKFKLKGACNNHEKSHTSQKNTSYGNLNEVKVKIEHLQSQIELINDSKLHDDDALTKNQSDTNLTTEKRIWFVCDICEKKFTSPNLLIIHRDSHSNNEPYKCILCNKVYNIKHLWSKHLNGHYMMNVKIQNSKSHKQMRLFANKLKNQSVDDKNLFKCENCKKGYKLITELRKHLLLNKICYSKSNSLKSTGLIQNQNNDTEYLEYKCDICQKMFTSLSNRNRHVKFAHNQKSRRNLLARKQRNRTNLLGYKQTNTTNLNFKSILNTRNSNILQQMEKYQVLVDSRHQCKQCGKSYSNKANLFRHLKSIHMGLFTIGKIVTDNKNKTKRQYLTKMNKKITLDYFCKVCKVKFDNNIALQQHEITHIVGEYDCKDCGQQFETNSTLGMHILEQHSVKTSLNTDEHTKNHVEQYNTPNSSKNDQIVCEVCFKVLKHSKYLPEHMRIHNNTKPFKCDCCKMSFRFSSNLKIHKKRHHASNIL